MTKPVLHLFPGFGGSGLFFDPLAKALAPEIECVAHVIPRHGPQDYAALVRHFTPQIERPCYLLAESFSGPLIILLAKAMPDKVRGIILSTTFAKSPYPPLMRDFMGVSAGWRKFMPLRKTFSKLFLLQGAAYPTADEIEDVMQQLSPAILRSRTKACVHVDVSDNFASLSQPALILNAKQDRAIGTGNFFPRKPTHCDVREFDCGHLLLQTMPEEAALAIKEFITDTEA